MFNITHFIEKQFNAIGVLHTGSNNRYILMSWYNFDAKSICYLKSIERKFSLKI
jgi:hypothetical protein